MALKYNGASILGINVIAEGATFYQGERVLGIAIVDDAVLFQNGSPAIGVHVVPNGTLFYNDQPVVGAVLIEDGRKFFNGARVLSVRDLLEGTSGPTPLVPNAPVLTWTSGTGDNTPNYSVNQPSGFGDYRDAADGDVIYLEIADNIAFTTTSTDTLDAADVTGNPVLMEQTTPLADGTYYARARLKRGASFGAYSNVETKTISTAVSNNRVTSTGDRRVTSTGDVRVYS